MRPIRTGIATSSKSSRMRVVALMASIMLLALTLGAGTALADSGRHHVDAQSTFTKWITAFPNQPGDVADMVGVVGGAVGKGTYAGEILKFTPGTVSVIEALYHFTGSRHAFSALVHIEQTGATPGSKAVISGVVTDGWLKGSPVAGKYTQITCNPAPTITTCYQGTLDILRGFGD